LEELDAGVEINSAWETIRESITISAKDSLSYYEMKKYKPWFNERYAAIKQQPVKTITD
jgi:hypothetical protein